MAQEEGAQKALQYTETGIKFSGSLTFKLFAWILDRAIHHKEYAVNKYATQQAHADVKIQKGSGIVLDSKEFDIMQENDQNYGKNVENFEDFFKIDTLPDAELNLSAVEKMAREEGVLLNLKTLPDGRHILEFRTKDADAVARLAKRYKDICIKNPEKLVKTKKGVTLQERLAKAQRKVDRRASKGTYKQKAKTKTATKGMGL